MRHVRRLVMMSLPYLPRRLRTLVARTLLGWRIHPTARLGRSSYDVDLVVMGPGSVIGPRNVFRGLDKVELGEGAGIAEGNHVLGVRGALAMYPGFDDRHAELVLGDYAQITMEHRIDCSDSVVLEHHAVLGGWGNVVLTHSLNLRTDGWLIKPMRIGHHAMVFSGCTVLVGRHIPAQSLVSAGSVVADRITEPLTIYTGNPAVAVRRIEDDWATLNRTEHFGTW